MKLIIFYIAFAVLLLYQGVAFRVWQYRNPKANAMTFYSHYLDVVTWKKLPEFQ